VLHLSDPCNKGVLAQHIICAQVYDIEIKVLTESEAEAETGVLAQLQRHLRALKTDAGYRHAYLSAATEVDWKAIALFFSAGLQPGPYERVAHY
jgi:hypothetical protein